MNKSMKDIQKKSDKDLKKFVSEKREELRILRFNASGSGMRDVKSIHNVKHEIAQALTEANARARRESTAATK